MGLIGNIFNDIKGFGSLNAKFKKQFVALYNMLYKYSFKEYEYSEELSRKKILVAVKELEQISNEFSNKEEPIRLYFPDGDFDTTIEIAFLAMLFSVASVIKNKRHYTYAHVAELFEIAKSEVKNKESSEIIKEFSKEHLISNDIEEEDSMMFVNSIGESGIYGNDLDELISEFQQFFIDEHILIKIENEVSIEQCEKLHGIEGKYIFKLYEKDNSTFLFGSFTDNLMKQTATEEINLGASDELTKYQGNVPDLIDSLKNKLAISHLKSVREWEQTEIFDKINKINKVSDYEKEINNKKNERKKLEEEFIRINEKSIVDKKEFLKEMLEAFEKKEKGDTTIDLSKYDIEKQKKDDEEINKKLDFLEAKRDTLDKEIKILQNKIISYYKE